MNPFDDFKVKPLLPNKTLGIITHKEHFLYKGEYYIDDGFLQYVDGLSEHFKKVVVVSPVTNINSTDKLKKIVNPRYQVYPTWSKTRRTIISWLARYYIASRTRKAFLDCDIINARFQSANALMAMPAIEAMKKPVFCSLVGPIYHYPASKNILKKYITRKVVRVLRKHVTFVHGPQLIDFYDLDPGQCSLCYSSTYYLKDMQNKLVAPPVGDEPIRLVFVGRLVADKGLDIIFKALASNPNFVKRFVLDVVGVGPLRSDLESLSYELGIQDIVKFHGFLDHGDKFSGILNSAHVMTFTPWNDGAPKVVTEGLRCGLPVLGTQAGGIPLVVEDGVNGWLVEPGNVAQVAETFKKILQMENAVWEQMSKACLVVARKHTVEESSRHIVQTLLDRKLIEP